MLKIHPDESAAFMDENPEEVVDNPIDELPAEDMGDGEGVSEEETKKDKDETSTEDVVTEPTDENVEGEQQSKTNNENDKESEEAVPTADKTEGKKDEVSIIQH